LWLDKLSAVCQNVVPHFEHGPVHDKFTFTDRF